MKLRTVFLLVVAVVCGTATSRITKRLISSPLEDKGPVEENVVVLAALQPISAGTVIREPDKLFEERTVPKSQEPGNALKKLYHLRGRRIAKAVAAGAIITSESLVDEERKGLELLKKEGRQAFVLSVAALGNALFLPDSRVDVVAEAPQGGAAENALIVVRNLPLLGIQSSNKDAASVTLAATQEETQKLQQAAAQGQLRIVSRTWR